MFEKACIQIQIGAWIRIWINTYIKYLDLQHCNKVSSNEIDEFSCSQLHLWFCVKGAVRESCSGREVPHPCSHRPHQTRGSSDKRNEADSTLFYSTVQSVVDAGFFFAALGVTRVLDFGCRLNCSVQVSVLKHIIMSIEKCLCVQWTIICNAVKQLIIFYIKISYKVLSFFL